MKTKGTVEARKLARAQTESERVEALYYGRASETVGGKLVVTIKGCQNSIQAFNGMLTRNPANRDGLRRLLSQVEANLANAQRDFAERSTAAIIGGNAGFFRDVAGSVDLIASAKGEPVDKYRAALHSFWWMLQAAQVPPTMRSIVSNLVRQFPEFQGREDELPRQVRRWCKELRLSLAKVKSARTGWHRGRVQKELRKLNHCIEDGDKAALLLLNTVSPELAEKARRLVRER